MWESLLGAALMFAVLSALGITRGRWLPQRPWVALWTIVSASLVAAMILDLATGDGTSSFAYGLALGYVAGVTFHTAHHFVEDIRGHAA